MVAKTEAEGDSFETLKLRNIETLPFATLVCSAEALMRRLAFLFVLLFSLPAFSQTKHPFTFEDMMKLKRVGEPVPSPDGKWVLFSVVDVDLAANKKTPHIWIVPLAGGQERMLIADQDGDRPRWAPDGKRFAFLSNREGGSQVWIADFDGAAGAVTGVQKVTSIATEAGGELWSPDGKNILLTSDVYPECDHAAGDNAEGQEASCNGAKLNEANTSKVKALIFERLLYRHWNAYKEGKRTHLFVVCVAPTCGCGGAKDGISTTSCSIARDLTPGDYDAPVFSLGGQDNYAFSPDGQEICYTSNHDKVEATSTNNDLWTVPVSWPANATPADVLAKTKNITADNPASDSTPLYSPDGKYIAFRAQQRPGYESDRFRLMLYDRKTTEKRNLTEDFDRWVGTFVWSPDSKGIYFTAEYRGRSPVYRIDAGGSPPSELSMCNWIEKLGTYDDLQFSSDGKTLVATWNTIKSPVELVAFEFRPSSPDSLCIGNGPMEELLTADEVAKRATSAAIEKEFDRAHATGGHAIEVGWRQITKLNEWLGLKSAWSFRHVHEFWFRGANGDPVEGFLVKPPNFDASKKYPVKFLIHGGPQGAWGDDWSYRWNPELFAANGYVVIMINFHGSTGYGQKFIDAINGDWGGAPFEDLMKGLDYAEKTYPFIDKDRECALGASYGGYAINWIMGHTDRFKCLVSHDGMFNAESAWGTTEELWFNNWEFKGTPLENRASYQKWSPHQYAKNFKTPTLVVHGQLDYRLDVSEGFQLFTTLQTMGVPSKMLYFPDEGHWVLKPQNSQLWWETVNDWVDQWVKK
jgi:dipeptidyl aminopeptidase/acylaminoacyl peptidase